VTGGFVEFVLDDGEALSLADEDAVRVYDTLWGFGTERGAVSTAALLNDALRQRPIARKPLMLTASQSALLRKAMSLLHA
jgi:hypothetical protein